MHKKIINALASVLAVLGILVGVVALISPIPVGVIIIALNVSILLCVNSVARQQLKRLRIRSHKVNHYLHRLESKLETRFVFLWRVFVKTRPPVIEPNDEHH
ncbi:hypothetical protein [Marinagarivorans algicola]|uniref:hypothetical protein n=1 Tax=Marinagarivorans algicola TaxID=1513270 RepID=UPI0006B3F91A|nr:hypothetical protein [Marinagarivorans algicola]